MENEQLAMDDDEETQHLPRDVSAAIAEMVAATPNMRLREEMDEELEQDDDPDWGKTDDELAWDMGFESDVEYQVASQRAFDLLMQGASLQDVMAETGLDEDALFIFKSMIDMAALPKNPMH